MAIDAIILQERRQRRSTGRGQGGGAGEERRGEEQMRNHANSSPLIVPVPLEYPRERAAPKEVE